MTEQRMCLDTFLCLRRSLATPTLYAAVCILSGAFYIRKALSEYKILSHTLPVLESQLEKTANLTVFSKMYFYKEW